MTQKAGLRYENELCNELHAAVTDSDIAVYPCGYSGNHAVPSPDILIDSSKVAYGIEVKRTSIEAGERTQFLTTDDVEQLCACANHHTRVYVALKCTRRQLVVCKVGWTQTIESAVESIVNRLPDAFDANHTASDNVTVRKPSTDDWPSSTKGDSDVAVICDELGIEYEVDDA